MADEKPAVATFRALHESGCFVLPNPWDRGSAVFLQHLGYEALATTSAGYAFSRAKPDAVSALTLQEVLDHVRDIVEATPLPVNADFQAGYAENTEELATNVRRCVETGVAGLSIEDATANAASPLYERGVAVERVRSARRAIDESGVPVVLTARCEAWLVGHPDPLREALERLAAFAAAGADCLYAPGVHDPRAIAAIVQAVSPRPVNVLVSAPVAGITLQALADLGVRRVSLGSALARAAWGAFVRAARDIRETGSFESLAAAASFDELNRTSAVEDRG